MNESTKKVLFPIGVVAVCLVLIVAVLIFALSAIKASKGGAETGIGTRTDIVVVEKRVAYGDITTTGTNIVDPVMGDWAVENVIVSTDVNTMSSGTLFQVVTSGNTYGTSTLVFSTQVSNFPKATTMDLNTPTVPYASALAGTGTASSTQRVVLDSGASLLVKCTVADCKRNTDGTESGTGYLKVRTFLRRIQNYGAIFD